MTSTLDAHLFAPLFSDDTVAGFFGDQAYLGTMLAVEDALAQVEARLGIIPTGAAAQIAGTIRSFVPDAQKIGEQTRRDGVPVIALVRMLREAVGPEAAPYVHWGATSQDIHDTATVLQLRKALHIIERRLASLIQALGDLVQRHRNTLMAGRTHGQQALPITFGLKAAGWLAPLLRHKTRLEAQRSTLLQLQFGGAAGTLAALGEHGTAVREALAFELDLNLAPMPWHSQRDGFTEFAGWLSMLSASQAKMAQDIILLAQNEVGEVMESGEDDRGGSSSMPQKRNPIVSELIIAAARTNAALLSAMHQAMIQEHERATHGWQVEWLTLSQMVVLTAGALKNAHFLAANLKVDRDRMQQNLARSNYIVLAEAAVLTLSKEMGRTKAFALVKEACGIATAENRSLIEVVKQRVGAAAPDNQIDWATLGKPENYLGQTRNFIDCVLEQARQL